MEGLFAMTMELVLGTGKLDQQAGRLGSISFAISCAIFAGVFVLLDVCIVYIRRKSFLQLEYRLSHAFGLFFAVPAAAAIVGWLGVGLDVLQATRAACIAVGIAWPFLLAALFNTSEGIGSASAEDTEPDEESI